MRIKHFRLQGIRCFDDTGFVELSPHCNVFVGRNNVGKSTILKSVTSLQSIPFQPSDRRPNFINSSYEFLFEDVTSKDTFAFEIERAGRIAVTYFVALSGNVRSSSATTPSSRVFNLREPKPLFLNSRPQNVIVPLLAKRKAMHFDENVSQAAQTNVSGTHQNLYARIDRLITGHPAKQEEFKLALEEIVGLPITMNSSPNGKQAGTHLTDEDFITLEQMGDGVTEMVGLIAELCSERGKIFVIEEPEAYVHPAGLKALMAIVRRSSEENQFLIATHSNIVLRELGYDERNRIFRVAPKSSDRLAASTIESMPRNTLAHVEMLKELGYEFGDYGLHDAWLFLEESSAEQIVSTVLIPAFAPNLQSRLRTFSAAGATNLVPSVSEFQRLMVFVHLQPAYRDRLWIRADNDEAGQKAIAFLKEKFDYLNDEKCALFSQPAFERYYPARYEQAVNSALQIASKTERRRAKRDLLLDVLRDSQGGALTLEWEKSAAEIIALLNVIEKAIA